MGNSTMKKLLLLLLFIPLVSCQDLEVRKTYYESGELESTTNYVDGLRTNMATPNWTFQSRQ